MPQTTWGFVGNSETNNIALTIWGAVGNSGTNFHELVQYFEPYHTTAILISHFVHTKSGPIWEKGNISKLFTYKQTAIEVPEKSKRNTSLT